MGSEPIDVNEINKISPTLLRAFDEDPGEKIIEKAMAFAKPGAQVGAVIGGIMTAAREPPPHINGFMYGVRKLGTAALIGGSFGAVLGIGVPIAQSIRGKNDPIAWAMGGYAAGMVFGVKGGHFRFALQMGALVAFVMAGSKITEGYKQPYRDPYKHIRGPIKYNKLFDEDGNMITYNQG